MCTRSDMPSNRNLPRYLDRRYLTKRVTGDRKARLPDCTFPAIALIEASTKRLAVLAFHFGPRPVEKTQPVPRDVILMPQS
jgi:hypothetical protein